MELIDNEIVICYHGINWKYQNKLLRRGIMRMTQKKMLALVLAVQMLIGLWGFSVFADTGTVNRSRMLKVSGNKIVLADDENTVVRLTGLNIPGAEWTGTPGVERITRSTKEAMENWDANLIRLPVSVSGWYGSYSYVNDGGKSYRNYIDSVISMVSEAGKYVVLDLHHYKCFDNPQYLTFWQEAAAKYANNPTVLFGILNEPHSVSWDVWRNGNGSNITGHQQVVEMIRDLGAKNIIIAAGLDWGYSLSGIGGESNYDLVDQGTENNSAKTGNGIVYDTHIYPWKGRTANWDASIGNARKKYPVLIGENGWDPDDPNMGNYAQGTSMWHDKWVPELFAWMNDEETYGNLANWTGWCFHPTSSPKILGDAANWKNDAVYSYPPTSFWGTYVKQQLHDDLGINLVKNKTVTSSGADDGYAAANAVDDDYTTVWKSTAAGDKYIAVDLGEEYLINRWVVRHGGTKLAASVNTKDFKFQISADGQTWTDKDTITDNTYNITDRFVAPVKTRYVRLYVTQAGQADNNLNIYEFGVYGKEESTGPVEEELPTEVVGNVGAGTITQHHLAVNFKNSTFLNADPKTIQSPNLANDDYVIWNQNTTKTSGLYALRNTDGINRSAHLIGSRKAAVPIEMKIDTHDASGTATPAPVTSSDKLVYYDMRLKRVSLSDDPVSFKLLDSAGAEIFELSFSANMIPQLKTNQTYGTLTADSAQTNVTYPFTEDWVYIRAILNFTDKTFELYQGATQDTMMPFVTGTQTFSFKNTSAADLYKLTTGVKGSLGFDDVAVYIVDQEQTGGDVQLPTEVTGNIGAGTINRHFAAQNFDNVTSVSNTVMHVPNLANNDYIVWNQNTTRTANFYTIKSGDSGNPSNYIMGSRKSQIPIEMTLDTHNASGDAVPAPALDGDKLIYYDMRLRRVDTTDDPVSFKLMDSAGAEIFELSFASGRIPQLKAAQTYGTLTNDPTQTDVTFPYSTDWVYIRAILNFNDKTFGLYQGATLDTLAPFVNGVDTFAFKNSGAANLYKMTTGIKGVLGFDDVNVYSVTPGTGGGGDEGETGTVSQRFVTQNFDNAVNVSNTVINVPNLANDDYIVWNQNTTKTANFYTIKSGDSVNQSSYIAGSRKSQIPIEMTIDTHDADGTATPAPAVESGKLLYCDMRIKRVDTTDDPVSLKLLDAAGAEIFELYFASSRIPQLKAAQTYGTLTNDPAQTDVTFPYSTDWVYVRAVIDFAQKTFELYQGNTLENLTPFVDGTTTFGFKNTAAANVYKLTVGWKGVLCFDDIDIYSMN